MKTVLWLAAFLVGGLALALPPVVHQTSKQLIGKQLVGMVVPKQLIGKHASGQEIGKQAGQPIGKKPIHGPIGKQDIFKELID